MNKQRGAIRELSYEEHVLHWVANLPNDEYLILLGYIWTVCPTNAETALRGRQLRIHKIITKILLPIMEEDGYIPVWLRPRLRRWGMSTWRIDQIMTQLYRQAMTKAGRRVYC